MRSLIQGLGLEEGFGKLREARSGNDQRFGFLDF